MLPEIIAKLKSPGPAGRRKPLRVEAPAGDPTCATDSAAGHGGRSANKSSSLPQSRAARRRSRSRLADVSSSVRSWQRRSRPRMAGGGREAREVGRSEERGIAVPTRGPRAGTTLQFPIRPFRAKWPSCDGKSPGMVMTRPRTATTALLKRARAELACIHMATSHSAILIPNSHVP
jgi:hypothetical protein